MMREYKEVVVTRVHTQPRDDKLSLIAADIYVVQPNGRKKNYKEVPASYIAYLMNPDNLVLNKVKKISASKVMDLENILFLEKFALKRKMNLIDMKNRVALQSGIISLNDLRKATEQYKFKPVKVA
jgi:hypothetical protein